MNDKNMKILTLAPIYLPISDQLKNAGSERIIRELNKSYYKLGHQSSVLAPGDSNLKGFGKLIPSRKKSFWSMNSSKQICENASESFEKLYKQAINLTKNNQYDIIHDHPGRFLANSKSFKEVAESFETPIIATLHNPIEGEKLTQALKWAEMKSKGVPIYFSAISNSQKNHFVNNLNLPIDFVVHNGVSLESLDYSENKLPYLFWMGRINDQKGTDLAIQIAKEAELPLVLAGHYSTQTDEFYQTKVKPHLTKSNDTLDSKAQEKAVNEFSSELEKGILNLEKNDTYFIGPVTDVQKAKLYKRATANLMPNRWDEPFGLVPVESMACGTPVIASKKGALVELIENNVTGYLIDFEESEKDFVNSCAQKVDEIRNLTPYNSRKHVENNFSDHTMAQNYLSIFKNILSK